MAPKSRESRSDSLVARALRGLQEFLRLEAAGGLLLVGAALLAMLVANSPLREGYEAFLHIEAEVRIGALGLEKPLLLWINDGLMAVFFLLVGLELKREVLEGHLSSPRRAALPAIAAVGGMLLPATIYAALNWGDAEAMRGWAIPSATDIAFALGALGLLGDRVPTSLKAFLLSVAIFDDVGSIVVIAAFYTDELSVPALLSASALVLGLAILNRHGVMRASAYFVLGIPLWVAVLKSGVHATLAGVALALFLPLRTNDGDEGPLPRLEHALHPWVAYGVLPVFAFANAGVSLRGLGLASFVDPVPLGIFCGLFFGKQLGVMSASWLATRWRLASLPEGVTWLQLYGASLLCGIGFTMSLFVASLAFEQGGGEGIVYPGLERLGIVAGSLVSAVVGTLVLRRAVASAEVDP
jgi:NhaA family Na+:H+ antiporter